MERIFDIHCQSEDTADLTLQGKMKPSTFDRYFPVPTGTLNDFAKQFQLRIVQIITVLFSRGLFLTNLGIQNCFPAGEHARKAELLNHIHDLK